MSRPFLSPARCEVGTLTSPLRRALLDTVSDTDSRSDAGLGGEGVRHHLVRDISLRGIVEIRGALETVTSGPGDDLVRLSPRRGYLFTDDNPVDVAERVRAGGVLAYDATGALAGMAIESEHVMRRLTDLDLDKLPTAGPFAHVTAIFRRDEDGWFEVYVQQELGHYVAEAVVDALAGLDMSRGLTPAEEHP